jgi:hypothetical protein
MKAYLAALTTTLSLLSVVLAGGCKSANVTSQREFAPVAAEKPQVVYVANFELGVQNIQHEDGLLSNRPGPVGRIGSRLSGAPEDPATRAQQLVDLMADSLVKQLAKAGFNAQRLIPGTPTPSQGWLVRGAFVEVQEGNRLRRAMIGFGQGETELQVVTTVNDLSQGPPKPLYELATEASSGNKPGAAPSLALGPWGAAARFVMSKHDLEKNVKQTASQVATQVSQRVQSPNQPAK